MDTQGLYKRYTPSLVPGEEESSEAWLFLFQDGRILIRDADDQPAIPTCADLDDHSLVEGCMRYFGELEDRPCYCAEITRAQEIPAGLRFSDLRALLGQMDEDLYLLAGRAFQIVNWNRKTRYCGQCGRETGEQEGELAKRCPDCGSVYYPRISPAIIVAVVRDGKILLAHNKNFRAKWYSVIAGFVEPGETFEDCVVREVREEVGVTVKNVQYFGSQPWPFPDSLMVGFMAEYDSGEITVDGEEIDAAGWYSPDALPEHPLTMTIAGRLIEAAVGRLSNRP